MINSVPKQSPASNSQIENKKKVDKKADVGKAEFKNNTQIDNKNKVNIKKQKKGKADIIGFIKDPIDNITTGFDVISSQSKAVGGIGKALSVSSKAGKIGSLAGNQLIRLSNVLVNSSNHNESTQRSALAKAAKITKKLKKPDLARNIASFGNEKTQRNIVAKVAKVAKAKTGKDSAKIVTTIGKLMSSDAGSKVVRQAPKAVVNLSRSAKVASFAGKALPGIGFVSGVVSTGLAINDAKNSKSWQGKALHITRSVANAVGSVASFAPGIGGVVGIGAAGLDIGLGIVADNFD